HDAAFCVADIFENKTCSSRALSDGNWILCHLAGKWRGNICARGRIRGGGDALGEFQPYCPFAFRRGFGRCRSISIYPLEDDDSARLPVAVRLYKRLPGTWKQFPPRLQTRRHLLLVLRRPDDDSGCAWNDESARDCRNRHRHRGGETPATS